MKRILQFQALLILGLFLCCKQSNDVALTPPWLHEGTEELINHALAPFYHGVASGDPLQNAVVIWTRVTYPGQGSIEVRWEVSDNEEFVRVLKEGTIMTDEDQDFTVKVDVGGLSPDTRYYYRFGIDKAFSQTGRTRTTPADHQSAQLKFAVVSCANWEWGFFNGYGRIADRDDINAVFHLGDYIYEYGPGGYGDTSMHRTVVPPHEILSLVDYRTRYAQYRLDPDLNRVHRMHPFIAIWDDHEITNNAHVTGAQNHQEDEGNYYIRKAIARQAYFEWLPIRETPDHEIYRKIAFGQTADLFMLDERLAGRSPQLNSIDDPMFHDSSRTMLGAEQLQWLQDELVSSHAKWRIIGNQVIFSDVNLKAAFPNFSLNFDAWDGYPAEKTKITGHLKNQSISNVVFVTGDTHSSWAFEVTESIENYSADPSTAVAIEFATPSISSSNYDERVTRDSAITAEQLLTESASNPHLKFVNLRDHGYLLLSLSDDKAIAEWWYSRTLHKRSADEFMGKRISVQAGTHALIVD